MKTQKLVYRIVDILQDKEMTCKEIMLVLNTQNNKKRNSSNRVTSYTSNQVGQLLRNKRFEKAGFCKKHNSNIWRNINAMDGEIQTTKNQ